MRTPSFQLLGLIIMTLCFVSCNNKKEELTPEVIETENKDNTKTSSEKEGYTINVTNSNYSINQVIVDELIAVFHEVYPKMVLEYNSSATKVVNVFIDTTYDGVAFAEIDKGQITISSKYINANTNDTDLLTHELMHLVQAYPYGGPGWLVEGIADYARHIYGVDNAKGGWSLPAYTNGQNYSNGYRVTASFLKWVKTTYDDTLINKLDYNLRNETYTYISWVENTGFTLPDLWLIYSGKSIGDKDWTIGSILKVSKENVGGHDAIEGSLKVIDGNFESKFLVFDYPSDLWMQQELSEKVIVNRYTLKSGNDVPERDPKNWILSGSDDEINWTDLDVIVDEKFNDRNQTKEYLFDSSNAYIYYRISITANNDAPIFQLSEWRLYQKNNQ